MLVLDTGYAALLGAAIGAAAATIGTLANIFAATRRSREEFSRSLAEKHIERIREGYHLILNVLSEQSNPDRTTRGEVFANAVLLASPEVREAIVTFQSHVSVEYQRDRDAIGQLMREHLASLEAKLILAGGRSAKRYLLP